MSSINPHIYNTYNGDVFGDMWRELMAINYIFTTVSSKRPIVLNLVPYLCFFVFGYNTCSLIDYCAFSQLGNEFLCVLDFG